MPKELAEKLHQKYPHGEQLGNDDAADAEKVTFPFVVTVDLKGEATFRGNPEAFKGPLVFDGEVNGESLYGEIWLGRAEDGKWGMLQQ